jgi:hypothetical protein
MLWPRATQDLDIWVRPTQDNAKQVIEALRAFGAPLHDLTAKDLATPGLIFQIGVEPIRIDVLTAIDGVQFDEAWAEGKLPRTGSRTEGQSPLCSSGSIFLTQ